jgi:hypothetical protein
MGIFSWNILQHALVSAFFGPDNFYPESLRIISSEPFDLYLKLQVFIDIFVTAHAIIRNVFRGKVNDVEFTYDVPLPYECASRPELRLKRP